MQRPPAPAASLPVTLTAADAQPADARQRAALRRVRRRLRSEINPEACDGVARQFQITSGRSRAPWGTWWWLGPRSATTPASWRPPARRRPFDRTGAPRWDWDPIPRTEDNPACADLVRARIRPRRAMPTLWDADGSGRAARGSWFVPTSSPSPDFFGWPAWSRATTGTPRSVVPLDGSNPQRALELPDLHHDIWDYDVPANPGLYSVWRDGSSCTTVAQVTKTGFVFVLNGRGHPRSSCPLRKRPRSPSRSPANGSRRSALSGGGNSQFL